MPTTPPTDPNCPFCEIVAREEDDTREVFRTDSVVAFFPPEPATLGHTLLIPRSHVRDIWDLSEDLAAELGRWTVKLAGAVKRAMRPDGLNVIQSNGTAATQTVMHLHMHVVPRWENDAVGRIWPPETHYSEGDKDDAWEALRREFRG
jgi:histidine triad (HIT) family protein